ncbi:MAG: nitroreductase family protein [Clostridia bacterium]|nr:nitroreductase family protein [Clostridia bacterium]
MIKDLVIKNRSYRTYDRGAVIPREKLLEYIDTARLTPSAVNLQPILYLPLSDRDADRILPYTGWAKALDIKLPPEGKGPSAFVLLCIDREKTPNPAPVMRDIGIVAQTLLLSAVEDGYGGCMIGSFDAAKIKAELELGENIDILLCVALGKPDERVVLEELEKDAPTAYWRDGDNVHHVPKRKLEDIVINTGVSD